MSYFPDYRTKGNYKQLNDADKSAAWAYAAALANVETAFDNLLYDAENDYEKAAIRQIWGRLYDAIDDDEKGFWIGIIESASYELNELENADDFEGGIWHYKHPTANGERYGWQQMFSPED